MLSVKILLLFGVFQSFRSFNIDDFGAISNDPSKKQGLANGKAFYDAVLAANSSLSEKTVIVSAGKNYTFLPHADFRDIFNVTIQIDGILFAWHDDIIDWPTNDRGNVLSMISFRNTVGLTIRGSGVVEGNGFTWWWVVFVTGQDNRPDLLDIVTCKDTLIEGVRFQNAPQYHLNLEDALNMTVQNMEIFVNISEFQYPESLPIFPLNTDGIDISGRDVVIRNLTILNYDDAVAVKPTRTNGAKYSNCTENILIENCWVKLGVGMSIGSVPPNINLNCIRNVTIRNIRFDTPFKAIYIKPNPGDIGTGLIEQILYENIEINDALWWAIYIGTQQQQQPHQTGTHCSFFYPLPGQSCPTNPRITLRDITLRNVTIHGGILSPGILICNETNPCTNMVFDSVNVYNRSVWPIHDGYLCSNFNGYAVNSNLVPNCFQTFKDDKTKRFKRTILDHNLN